MSSDPIPLRKFLVPLDGSEASSRVLEITERLIARQEGGLVSLIRVVPAYESDEFLEAAAANLAEVRSRLSAQGVPTAVHLPRGDAAEEILREIETHPPDLVAMANRGLSGIERWLRGSVAERVLRSSPAPLLLLNPLAESSREGQPFERILVPLDGSELAAEVLPLVREVAACYDSELILLHVGSLARPAEGGYVEPQGEDELREVLEPLRAELSEAGLKVRAVGACGDPASQILRAAEAEGADLVALSSHGRSGASRWWFGSVAEAVLRRCPTPVLIKRATPS